MLAIADLWLDSARRGGTGGWSDSTATRRTNANTANATGAQVDGSGESAATSVNVALVSGFPDES